MNYRALNLNFAPLYAYSTVYIYRQKLIPGVLSSRNNQRHNLFHLLGD